MELALCIVSSLFFVSVAINVFWMIKSLLVKKFFGKGTKALVCAAYNDLCGKKCDYDPSTMAVPEVVTDIFSANTAMFCTEIIRRFISAAKTNTEFEGPDGLTEVTRLCLSNSPMPTIGIVCKDNSRRLWVIFRGTNTASEIKSDLNFSEIIVGEVGIHEGFAQLYSEFRDVLLLTIQEQNPLQIIVTGHSMGAALATLVMADIRDRPLVGYGFGSPRVGDARFCESFTSPWFNVMNVSDFFTNLPLAVMPNVQNPQKPFLYKHAGLLISFSENWGSWMANHQLPVYQDFLTQQLRTST